jgi:hypothetical protein
MFNGWNEGTTICATLIQWFFGESSETCLSQDAGKRRKGKIQGVLCGYFCYETEVPQVDRRDFSSVDRCLAAEKTASDQSGRVMRPAAHP